MTTPALPGSITSSLEARGTRPIPQPFHPTQKGADPGQQRSPWHGQRGRGLRPCGGALDSPVPLLVGHRKPDAALWAPRHTREIKEPASSSADVTLSLLAGIQR